MACLPRSTTDARVPGLIRMGIRVNGSTEAVAQTYTDEQGSHKAFVDGYAVVTGLPAGNHDIRLESVYNDSFCDTASENNFTICTSTSGRDSYAVNVVEIPD